MAPTHQTPSKLTTNQHSSSSHVWSSRDSLRKPNINHQQQQQQLSTSHKRPSIASYIVNTSEDYGLYFETNDEGDMVLDQMEDYFMLNRLEHTCSPSSVSTLSPNSSCDDTTPEHSSPSSSSSFASSVQKETTKNIVFVFENNRAPVTCRSFESLSSSRITQVCIAVEGFRIVQDEINGEEAEFKIRLLMNSKEVSAWKSYKDFEVLALSLQEFSAGECTTSNSWIAMFRPAPQMARLLRRSEGSIALTESLIAWDKIVEQRLWGWALARNLNVKFLMEQADLLSSFCRSILYEIPHPDVLVEFLATH